MKSAPRPESDPTSRAEGRLAWSYWGAGFLVLLASLFSVVGLAQGRSLGLEAPPDGHCEFVVQEQCVVEIGGVSISDRYVHDPSLSYGMGALLDWVALQQALNAAQSDSVSVRLADGQQLFLTPRSSLHGGKGFAAALFAALLVAASGLWAGRRHGGKLGRDLMLVAVGASLNLIPLFYVTQRGVFAPTWVSISQHVFNGVGAFGGTLHLLAFALSFPQPLVRERRVRGMLVVGWALTPIAILLDFVSYSGVIQVSTFIPTFGAVGALIYGAIKSRQVVQRLQAAWIGWGFGATVFVALVFSAPNWLGQPLPPDVLMVGTALAFLPISIGLGLAASRVRLLLLRSVLQWSGAVGAAALLVIAYGAATERISVPLFLLIPAAGLLLGMVPQALGREQQAAREALERLPHDLAGMDSLEAAREAFLSRVRAVTGSRPVHLILRSDPASEDLPLEGMPTTAPVLSDSQREDAAQAWLDAHQGELLIPVGTSQGLVGAVVVGKGPGPLPMPRDLQALQSASAAMGATASHRMALETIQDLNRGLEVLVERRTAERDEARLRSFRWERVAALSTLSAGIGHELSSPLGVALSSMDQLMTALEKGKVERAMKFGRLTQDGVRRASEIIRNLQVFSRPGIDRLQRFDPMEGLAISQRLLQKRMDRKGLKLVVEGDPPRLNGYPVLVHQVLYNLLHNAVKMSPAEGVITLRFQEKGDDLLLVVQDQGPGIPPELQRTLFDPFETTGDESNASGLGLSLCASFVTLHGGRIWQDDPPDGGARFSVLLPLAGPAKEQAGVLSAH